MRFHGFFLLSEIHLGSSNKQCHLDSCVEAISGSTSSGDIDNFWIVCLEGRRVRWTCGCWQHARSWNVRRTHLSERLSFNSAVSFGLRPYPGGKAGSPGERGSCTKARWRLQRPWDLHKLYIHERSPPKSTLLPPQQDLGRYPHQPIFR